MKNQFALILIVVLLHETFCNNVMRLKAIPNHHHIFNRKIANNMHAPVQSLHGLHKHTWQKPVHSLREEAIHRNRRKLDDEMGEEEGEVEGKLFI
jgi:hypothetical protein